MLMETVPKQEADLMFDDLKLAPKDEDEMEDFRDYDDESDDVDSKLDTNKTGGDDEDEDESIATPAPAPPIPVITGSEEQAEVTIVVIEEEEPEAPVERKPAKSAKKASPKPVVKKATA